VREYSPSAIFYGVALTVILQHLLPSRLIITLFQVYSGAIHPSQPFTNIPVIPTTTSYDVVKLTLSKLGINERPAEYQLAEVRIA